MAFSLRQTLHLIHKAHPIWGCSAAAWVYPITSHPNHLYEQNSTNVYEMISRFGFGPYCYRGEGDPNLNNGGFFFGSPTWIIIIFATVQNGK